MTNGENRIKDNSEIKEKIRSRYKGIGEDLLDVIPANPQEDFYRSETQKKVAVYARVSTDDPNQTSSYELQKNHYEDMVNQRSNWELVDIYADEGISGTSLQHRDEFVRMINDCRDGKIDLIVTKSVSRFARNIIDCIGYVRQLKALESPVGVFFETENIFTLDENSEMALSFIATLAQEESHSKSEIMNASIEMRFKRGVFLTPKLLGYDHDENGDLIINEEEAKTVRLIFFSYLYGYSSQQIADALTQLECFTKKGNQFWSAGSVLQILSNERYCGDVLARKTFTPNYLNHKSKKNNHDRNQYRQKNHHEAIISREDFFAVQKLIRNAKYGNKGYFPEMHVIRTGILRGYVSVHPRWAGFNEQDYYLACSSTENVVLLPSTPKEIKISKGRIDLTGYELVRTPFMNTSKQMMLSVTANAMLFNKYCIEKLRNIEKIDLYVHPEKKSIAIKKASGTNRNYMIWSKQKGNEVIPRQISGAAFLPTLFQIFGWRKDTRYKMVGTSINVNGDAVICFSAKDAILYIENIPDEEDTGSPHKIRRTKAYPAKWADSFGDDYYTACAQFEMEQIEKNDTCIDDSKEVFLKEDEGVTPRQEVIQGMHKLIEQIGEHDE